MANAADTFGAIYQNLLDAGCGDHTVENCMMYAKNGGSIIRRNIKWKKN